MFGRAIKLFTIFGFTVKLDASWLIIMVLIVWSLAGAVFPAEYKGLHWGVYLAMGLAAAVALFASIVIHELSHSLVARRYGTPMKGITLFLLGGVAEMRDEPPSAKAEFSMAIAGPLASVALAGIFIGLGYLGAWANWPGPLVGVLKWIGFINGILAVFNMIPGFPLDGGRVLRAALWQWKGDLQAATRTAAGVGAGFGAVLIGLGVLSLLLGNPIGGLWWILIGLFVRSAAKSGYQQVLIRRALQGEPVRRFMSTDPVTVQSSLSVESLVDDYVYRYHFKMFPIVDDGRLDGCVNTQQIKTVPRGQWPQHTVGELASGCSEANTIAPDADAIEAFQRMNQYQVSRLMVVQDSTLVGILALKDLLKFLSMKLELEGGKSFTPPAEAQLQFSSEGWEE